MLSNARRKHRLTGEYDERDRYQQGPDYYPEAGSGSPGIGPGSEVDFERAEDGRVVLVKIRKKIRPNRFARLRGHAGKGLSTAEIMAMTRGERYVILVDTNVLLDLVTDDPDWAEWSLARLEEAALAGPVLINDIVYAETSIRYHRIEDLDAMLARAMIEIAATPRSALFLAGKAFSDTAGPAVCGRASCLIFSSVPTPQSKAGRC